MSSIRYPGAKTKLRGVILSQFPQGYTPGGLFHEKGLTYVEPFFGSGAVTWENLAGLGDGTKVAINDKDYWLMCLWTTVKQQPEELISKIKSAQLSPALFEEYRATDGDRSIDPAEAGFRKLLLHQMSFSGLGVKAGGPIGGKAQENVQYTIEARWKNEIQIERVRQRHVLLNRFDVQIHCEDFESVIQKYDSKDTFFYLDPPYVVKGSQLYKHAFDVGDHVRLAGILSEVAGKFILSYDDCELVRNLYSDYRIRDINVVYSVNTSRKNSELLIMNY